MKPNRAANRRVFHNAFYLAVLQLFNFLIPLLLLPYLTRTLTIEEFGAVMVVLSSTIFAYVITDYGFSLSATYFISRHRDDHNAVQNTISRIFSAKILLIGAASILLLGISMLPVYRSYQSIFWAAPLAVIAQAYQPIWFFHGMERMKYYTGYMALTRLTYLALVLLIVKEPGHGYRVLLSWSLAQLLGLAISVKMMHRLGYRFGFAPPSAALEELRSSAQFFYSRLAVAMYTAAGSIIVGTSNLHQAALYASSEQIYKAGQAVTQPINQALHPFMARNKDWRLFFTLLPMVTGILALGSLIVYVYRDFFISLLFGENYLEATSVLTVFLATLLINYVGASFGYPACAAIGRADIANRTVLAGFAIFALTVGALFILDQVNARNIALAVMVTETLVAFLRTILVLGNRKLQETS